MLNWRNTPSEDFETSPAQRFLGRCCRTQLPITEKLLQPRFDTYKDTEAIRTLKKKQEYYYNQHVKELAAIQPGDPIQMKLPGDTLWSRGVCTSLAGTRSYTEKVGLREKKYRRNRKQLILINPLPSSHQPDPATGKRQVQNSDKCIEHRKEPQAEREATLEKQSPCRSGRVKKKPTWMDDYVPSD